MSIEFHLQSPVAEKSSKAATGSDFENKNMKTVGQSFLTSYHDLEQCRPSQAQGPLAILF